MAPSQVFPFVGGQGGMNQDELPTLPELHFQLNKESSQ